MLSLESEEDNIQKVENELQEKYSWKDSLVAFIHVS